MSIDLHILNRVNYQSFLEFGESHDLAWYYLDVTFWNWDWLNDRNKTIRHHCRTMVATSCGSHWPVFYFPFSCFEWLAPISVNYVMFKWQSSDRSPVIICKFCFFHRNCLQHSPINCRTVQAAPLHTVNLTRFNFGQRRWWQMYWLLRMFSYLGE